jgi:hypothetical protein
MVCAGDAETAAKVYLTMRAEQKRKGQVIGNSDPRIAAHAKAAGLTPATNSEREVRRMRSLKCRMGRCSGPTRFVRCRASGVVAHRPES